MASLPLYAGGAIAFLTSAALYWRGKDQQRRIDELKTQGEASRPAQPRTDRLRVLSQNVWGHMLGSGGKDIAGRLAALAKYIEANNVDVVLVQELFTLSAGPIYEGSHFLHFSQAMNKAGLKHIAGGETFKSVFQNHGLAIFSRYPIVRSMAEPFPTSSEPINSKGYCCATVRVPAARVDGASPADAEDLFVHLFNVHLDSRDHQSKKRQVEFLSSAVRRYMASAPASLSALTAPHQTVIPLAPAAASSSSSDGAFRGKKRKSSSESPMAGDDDEDDGAPEDLAHEDAPLLSPVTGPSSEQTGPALRPRVAAAAGAGSSSAVPSAAGAGRRNSLSRSSSAPAPPTSSALGSSDPIVVIAGDFNICSFNAKATPPWLYPYLQERMAYAGAPSDLFPGPGKGAYTGVSDGASEDEGDSTPTSPPTPAGGLIGTSASSDSATIPTCYSKRKGFRALDHAWLSPEARRRVAALPAGSAAAAADDDVDDGAGGEGTALLRRVLCLYMDGHCDFDGRDYRAAPPVSDHRGLLFDLSLSTPGASTDAIRSSRRSSHDHVEGPSTTADSVLLKL